MGLDFGFNKAKRYKDATLADIRRIETYDDWKKWNNKTYTQEEYLKEFSDGLPLPAQDIVDFYTGIIEKNQFAYTNLGNMCGWDNTYIYEAMTEFLEKSDDYHFIVPNEEAASEMLKWVNEELEKYKLTPVNIVHGITAPKRGNGSLIDLSGIIVRSEDEEDDEGDAEEKIVRLTEYTTIYIPSKGFDSYRYWDLRYFRDILLKVQATDFDNNIVWMYVSY